MAVRAAEDRAHEPPQHSGVRLRTERRQCERAVGRPLVADRGHARLADRELEVQRAEACDDLRRRRAGGKQPRRARGHRRLQRRGRASERGQEHGHERHEGDRDQDGETAQTPFALQVPAARPTRTPPVGHRGRHGGHRSERLFRFQPGKHRGVERGCPVERVLPIPIGRAERPRRAGSIGAVSAVGRPPRMRVPRWLQLVGLPLLLILGWVLLTAVIHVVFLFLVAALVALLLDPLTRMLQRVRLPRGLSVAFVYLMFAAALGLVIFALATAVVSQTKTAANRFNDYFTHPHAGSGRTSAYLDVDRLQHWLDTHHLKSVKIEKRGHRLVRQIQQRDVGKYTHRIVTFVEGAAISIGKTLFSAVLLLVVSIYMLLDMQRFGGMIDRRFPPRPGERALLRSIEHALASYVRGQAALSLIIGTSAGFGLWLLSVVGLLPHAQQYALLFGAWVAVTEVIPYLGPWLGAI